MQREISPPSDWDSLVARFIEETFEARPHFGVSSGRHEFDGRLPDWSPDGIQREIARLRDARNRALAFEPESLDARQRFEREHLIATIDGNLFWTETLDGPHRRPDYYAFAFDPNVYVARDYAPVADRMRAYTAYARDVPRATRQVMANLRRPLPRTFVDLARTHFGGFATYYENDVPAAFAAVDDDALRSEFAEANAGAITAMRALDQWFEAAAGDATDRYALGPDLFREMLWATERVDVPLDELEAIGRVDLERNLAALSDACRELSTNSTIAECIRRVQANKPADGPIAEARRQLGDLRAFTVEHDLVSIPGTEEARVEESPPYMRWNAAFIDIPGPYEQDLPSTYYISPPDPAWAAADQKAYIPALTDLLYISVHEVWPGHFLQFLHAHGVGSDLGRVFSSYAFSEGWAHYAEELMAEAGLGRESAEIRIGQLLNALLRNVRFLAAIGLHAGTMTVGEAETMFREQAFQDPGNARQQAARGTFDPAYLNYTMGKLMIRKLREDWTVTRGGRAAWREFHDTFLGYGAPPIPLIRATMVGDGSLF
jgi:hypothetical protein